MTERDTQTRRDKLPEEISLKRIYKSINILYKTDMKFLQNECALEKL